MKVTAGAAGELKINLLPAELKLQKEKENRNKAFILFVVLLLLNLSLIGNVYFLHVKAKQEFLNYLKSEVKAIDRKTSSLQKKMQKVEVLHNYINSSKFSLGLLSVLYRIAPEGLYLTALDIYGHSPDGVIVLLGQAKDPARVLKFANTLKGTGIVSKAEVNYISKRNVTGQEVVDFEIKSQF